MASQYALFLFIAVQVCATLAKPPCVCTRDMRPVCGSDGNTYGNECLLDCARLTMKPDLTKAKDGRCIVQKVPTCSCTDEYEPVCGTDGTTYPNSCSLECQQALDSDLKMIHPGACEQVKTAKIPLCKCTLEYEPVCGSDGMTYGNDCALNCATANNNMLSIAHRGVCVEAEELVVEEAEPERPKCKCTKNMRPVCGSDGNTYSNQCLLECAADQNPLLTVEHKGRCQKPRSQPVSCACTRNFRPVCGADGVTYSNLCLMKCAGTEMARDAPCDE